MWQFMRTRRRAVREGRRKVMQKHEERLQASSWPVIKTRLNQAWEADRDMSFAYNGLIDSGQQVCFSPVAAEELVKQQKS